MKQLVKNALCLLTLVCAILIIFSCEQDAILKKYVYPMPEVTQIYPTRGYVTQPFTILGSNFGDRTEPVKVFFGGVPVKKVISCKDNCIVVEVPEDAIDGEVTLQVWTNPVISVGNFEVHSLPSITSITSNNEHGTAVAAPGDEVVIIGTNFGTNKDKVSVSFNGTAATVESVEDNRIVVITPDDYESGEVTVTISQYTEYTMTGTKLVNPTKPGDVTALYLKNYTRPFVQFAYKDGQQGDGTMAIPTEWIVNEAARQYINKNATYVDERVGGMFHNNDALGMQTGWGHPSSPLSVTNGKMYQVATVTPGKYELIMTCIEVNVATDHVYLVVNRGGDGLPDADQVEGNSNVVVSSNFTNVAYNATPVVTKLDFTLQEETELSIGFVASFGKDKYFKVSDIQLNLVEVID